MISQKIKNFFQKKSENTTETQLLQKIQNLLRKISKENFSLWALWMYVLGVFYQLFFLMFRVTESGISFSNVAFFSFTHSLNDFLIILGNSSVFYVLAIILWIFSNGIVHLLQKFIKNSFTEIIILNILFLILSVLLLVGMSGLMFKMLIFWLVIVGIFNNIFYLKKESTIAFIGFMLFQYLFTFASMLYDYSEYYGCFKLWEINEKDCVLLKYRNDKFVFTGKGDIYRLEEVKSYYTYDYFENNKEKSEEK